ncbi:hypothetical protein E4H12_05885 [Candidatus Thorarchaeota archaeon]|nr:MAG: hypothetical protein E4H12_05885 [Candidatus Thorarchaeota archaeon]
MKLKFLSLTFALLFIFSSVPLVTDAQSNHSLQWGVDVDEEFTYVMQRAYFADPSYTLVVAADLPFVSSMTVGEKVTLRVTDLDVIPTLINESSQMVNSTCEMERANDSVSIRTGVLGFVIPIGDWNFINEMTNITGLEGVTLIDTEDEWGTSGAGLFLAGDGSVVSITIDLIYEKENGTLNYLRHRYSTLGTDLIDIIIVNWHEGMATIVAPELQTPTLLIISIAAVVILVVSILVYQGYRGKKPVVQKLGE